MVSGPGPDPSDFGMDGHSEQDNWRDSGYTHHTVHDSEGNTFSWNEAEYTDSNGVEHRDVANPHANDGSQW